MDFALDAQRRGSDTVITITGEIDIGARRLLRRQFLRALRPCEPHLLIDLSGATFFDCSGIRVLLEARRWAELRGGSLRLIAASEPVRRVIKLVGLQGALSSPSRIDRQRARSGWPGRHGKTTREVAQGAHIPAVGG